jgi:hypothetical protein
MMMSSEDWDLTIMSQTEPAFGMQMGEKPLLVHPRSRCEGRDIPCCIHNTSIHHMITWPMNWRGDTGVMERMCEHGVGHPDPDHMTYVMSLTPEDHWCPYEHGWNDTPCKYPHLEYQGIHGCDGCCAPA